MSEGAHNVTLRDVAEMIAGWSAVDVERRLGASFLVSTKRTGAMVWRERDPDATMPGAAAPVGVVAPPMLTFVVHSLGAGNLPLVLGRDPASDILLDDVTVSRRHAALAPGDEGLLTVTDLGSRNGTSVDRRAVRPAGPCTRAVARPGSRLLFGLVECTLCDARGLLFVAASAERRSRAHEAVS